MGDYAVSRHCASGHSALSTWKAVPPLNLHNTQTFTLSAWYLSLSLVRIYDPTLSSGRTRGCLRERIAFSCAACARVLVVFSCARFLSLFRISDLTLLSGRTRDPGISERENRLLLRGPSACSRCVQLCLLVLLLPVCFSLYPRTLTH